MTAWAAVTLSTDAAVDTGIVDLRKGGPGGPGVEREVVTEKLDGNSVVDVVAASFVVALIEEDKLVGEVRLTSTVDKDTPGAEGLMS